MQQKPPLYLTDPSRLTSCYLYKSAEPVSNEGLVGVLAQVRSTAPATALEPAETSA